MTTRSHADDPKGAAAARLAMFMELVERKSWLQLATPYFSVEARILDLKGEVLHLRVHLSREALTHALGQHPVRLRFPWNLGMYAGITQLLEVVEEEGKRVARVTLPERVAVDERRKAFRVERTGRSRATLALPDGRLIRATLESISTLGAGLFALDALKRDDLHAGQTLPMDVELDGALRFKTTARIQHLEGLNLGISFHPSLDPLAENDVAGWIAPRRRDAQRLWDNRMELRAEAHKSVAEKRQPEGTILLTGDPSLAEQLGPALEGCMPVRTALPSVGAVKRLLDPPPRLLVVDLPALDSHARHRTRLLLEALNLGVPLMLVGRGQDPVAGRAFATDLKADLYLDWLPDKAPFLTRLIQGFLARLSRDGES